MKLVQSKKHGEQYRACKVTTSLSHPIDPRMGQYITVREDLHLAQREVFVTTGPLGGSKVFDGQWVLVKDSCVQLILDPEEFQDKFKLVGETQTPKQHESPIMQYFNRSEKLTGKLEEASKPFCDLAGEMESTLKPSPEKAAGLRKLLEAKDCFVRAALGE